MAEPHEFKRGDQVSDARGAGRGTVVAVRPNDPGDGTVAVEWPRSGGGTRTRWYRARDLAPVEAAAP